MKITVSSLALVLALVLAFPIMAQGAPSAGKPDVDPSGQESGLPIVSDQVPSNADVGKEAVAAKEAGIAHTAAECPCPMCPMKKDAKMSHDHKPGDKAAMRHTTMLMDAELAKDDPAALLALRDDLKLTDDQARQIEQIQRQTRERVENVLTAEQKQELAQLPDKATSMRNYHRDIASRAHGTSPSEANADTTAAGDALNDAIDTESSRAASADENTP